SRRAVFLPPIECSLLGNPEHITFAQCYYNREPALPQRIQAINRRISRVVTSPPSPSQLLTSPPAPPRTGEGCLVPSRPASRRGSCMVPRLPLPLRGGGGAALWPRSGQRRGPGPGWGERLTYELGQVGAGAPQAFRLCLPGAVVAVVLQ